MSTPNFGLNPVIPTPVPSAGAAKGYSTLSALQTPQTNPVFDAVAGPKCNIVWVENLDEVLAHPVSPNEEMYFHDKNEPIIYKRDTDGNGNVKNPIYALHYTVEEVPFGPEAQFVTKDEHKQLYELVEKLAGNIDSMNGKLEQLLNG